MSMYSRRQIYAGLWFVAAFILMARSLAYLGIGSSDEIVPLSTDDMPIALGCAFFVGLLKGMTVLRKAARRNVMNLIEAGPEAPLRTVFPIRLLALIAFMMGLGFAIRLTPYDPVMKAWVIGILYPGIGFGLMIGGLEILRFRPERQGN